MNSGLLFSANTLLRVLRTRFLKYFIFVRLIIGFIFLTYVSAWFGVGRANLNNFSLVSDNLVYAGNHDLSSRIVVFIFLVIGVVACSSPRRIGESSVDFLQMISAFWLIVSASVLVFLTSSLEFAQKDSHCIHSSCFPFPAQELLIILPVLLVATIMIFCSLLASRISWSIRVSGPSLIFLVSFVAQYFFWDSVVLSSWFSINI